MSSTRPGPTWAGTRAVAAAQLRHRRRTSRWVRALVVWCGVLAGVLLVATALLPWLLPPINSYSGIAAGPGVPRFGPFPEIEVPVGPTLFAVVALTMLAGGVLVGARLVATSPNELPELPGSSPADRTIGTVLASWTAACALVVVGIPFLALTLVAGAGPVAAVPRVVLVVAALLAAVCGIAQGLRTPDRSPTSVVRLTVGAVVATSLCTPLLVALATPLVTTTGPVQVYTVLASSPTNTDNPTCGYEPAVRRATHTERSWWLQVINPVVVLADAAGTSDPGPSMRDRVSWAVDPLDGVRRSVRLLRAGSPLQLDECYSPASDASIEQSVSTTAFWGWGLILWALLGAGGVALSVRRQRV